MALYNLSNKFAEIAEVGTVTKNPVATNAELTAYSGFSAANYFREPYSADLDFGVGEWSASAWVNVPVTLPEANFPELGSTLILNGLFGTNADNWTAVSSTLSIVGGQLRITNTTTVAGYAHQSFATVVGKIYKAKVTWTAGTSTTGSIRIGTAADGTQNRSATAASGVNTLYFIATATTTFITIKNGSIIANEYSDYDTISVLEVLSTPIMSRSYSSGNSIQLSLIPTGQLTSIISDGTTTRTVTSAAAYNTATWTKVRANYTTDGTLALQVNGNTVASTTGSPLLTLNNADAVLTIGNNYAANAPFPGSLALVKLSATVPTAAQSLWMFEQEKPLFNIDAKCLLPDANEVNNLTYDDASDAWLIASDTNQSTWQGLIRTKVTPSPAGIIDTITANSGVSLQARSVTDPGVDVTMPSVNLRAKPVIQNPYLGDLAYQNYSNLIIRVKDNILKVRENDIGLAGDAGFGVGIYPGSLPAGFIDMTGNDNKGSDNYGNYQFVSDSSVMCWIPKFYYRIGSPLSPNYPIYRLNAIDIASVYDFVDETTANTAGYVLHRAFKNGGATKNGFMFDKYEWSKNPGATIASSLKNGNPITSIATHNGFSTVSGGNSVTVENYYYGALQAAKTRGNQFHCVARFQFAALALLATAHGQAAISTAWCAWFDANRVINFPKGNNNNALRDTNDTSVLYVSNGHATYPLCGKTGSANQFAKTTHNGQNCGVADLNGNLWEINTGMVRPGASAGDTAQQNNFDDFYLLKESVDVNSLTSGFSTLESGFEAWGDALHLATLYNKTTLSHIASAATANRFGNGVNQVLGIDSSSQSSVLNTLTGFGIPKDTNAKSGSGSNLFGTDYFYEKHQANLCLLSSGHWANASDAGVWALDLADCRPDSDRNVGGRAAAYV